MRQRITTTAPRFKTASNLRSKRYQLNSISDKTPLGRNSLNYAVRRGRRLGAPHASGFCAPFLLIFFREQNTISKALKKKNRTTKTLIDIPNIHRKMSFSLFSRRIPSSVLRIPLIVFLHFFQNFIHGFIVYLFLLDPVR